MISKRYLLSIFLFIAFCNAFFGQGIKSKKISLISKSDVKGKDVNFYVENVIDNRFSKTYLGIVQIGIYNARMPLAFEEDFSTEIQDYLNLAFPKKPGLIPITIRINDLIISEDTQVIKEQGRAQVQLDVLKFIDKNTYDLLGRYSAISTKNTLDATGSHPSRIKAALMECLLSFHKENPDFAIGERLNLKNFNGQAPILSESPKPGFFYSFFELQNNRPVEDDGVKSTIPQKREKTEKSILVDENDKNANYAAYFDGNNFFINSNLYFDEAYFIKTYRVDHFLLFNEMFFPGEGHASALNLATGRSGMPFLKERNCILFDLATGKFHIISRDKMKMLLDENYPDLYKRYKRYGRKDVIEVFEILNIIFNEEKPEYVRATLTS